MAELAVDEIEDEEEEEEEEQEEWRPDGSEAETEEEEASSASAPPPAMITFLDEYKCDSNNPLKDEADLVATCKVMLQVAQKSINTSRSLLNARAPGSGRSFLQIAMQCLAVVSGRPSQRSRRMITDIIKKRGTLKWLRLNERDKEGRNLSHLLCERVHTAQPRTASQTSTDVGWLTRCGVLVCFQSCDLHSFMQVAHFNPDFGSKCGGDERG